MSTQAFLVCQLVGHANELAPIESWVVASLAGQYPPTGCHFVSLVYPEVACLEVAEASWTVAGMTDEPRQSVKKASTVETFQAEQELQSCLQHCQPRHLTKESAQMQN